MGIARRNNRLTYDPGRKYQTTVKRQYIKWRLEQTPPLPIRCDISKCNFHKHALIWNGKKINPILDHINGVSGDNRPENLRLLCPNCNSQQPTQGGGNKGRTDQQGGGFSIKRSDGKKDYIMPVPTAKFTITGNDVTFITHKNDDCT